MQLLGSNSWEGAGGGDSADQTPARGSEARPRRARKTQTQRPGPRSRRPEAPLPRASPAPCVKNGGPARARRPQGPPRSRHRDLGPRGRPGPPAPAALTCRSRTGAPAPRCRLSCRPATLSAAPAIARPDGD